MVVHQQFTWEISKPSGLQFLYLVTVACVLFAAVLHVMGAGALAGLAGAYAIFLVALAVFSNLLIWVLRQAG